LAFESLPGIKVRDYDTNRDFLVADFFSVYNESEELPEIYRWSDFETITESRDAFILDNGKKVFTMSKDFIPDPAIQLRIRAIIEGAVAANPNIDYRHGKRILPPKTFCSGFEIPLDAYTATGIYRESEINNSNVILQNPGFDKMIWIFTPIAAVAAFVLQALFWGDVLSNIITYLVISIFTGAVVGVSIYLFCVYASKTLYGKIFKEDIAIVEEITFVICDDGFMAAETEVYDFSDIIFWHEVAYFIETNQLFIIFNHNKAVLWLPKRVFPKEMHKEIGDFIADKLQSRTKSEKSEPEKVPAD
jgi:hypothetical protein